MLLSIIFCIPSGDIPACDCGSLLQAESGKECKGVEYAKGNQLCAGTYSIMQPDQLFLLIEVAKELISAQMVVLCMCIIFVIIITNYIIFLMIEKYTTVEENSTKRK